MDKSNLRDIQSEPDFRRIPINDVGVKDITYPVVVLDRNRGKQHTIAKVNMYVSLPHHFRGTHMSRFIEILNKHRDGIDTRKVKEILKDMKDQLEAERAHFEIEFPFFMTKSAPVSGAKGLMDYVCRLIGTSDRSYYEVEVRVPVLSLCPCSKEISSYGAHNQRSFLSIRVRANYSNIIWIEDIIAIAESSGSSEIYSLLKREDEKFVTETSYNTPVFVEDIVRNATEKMQQLKGVLWFSVESENMESIHNHSAYARIEMAL